MTDAATDISRGENVEAELDRLIEKRAKIGDVEAREELWKMSVRRHEAGVKRRNRAAWFTYFCGQARAHAALAADYERRAEELCEEGAL